MPPSHPILPAIPTTHKLPSSSSAAAAAAVQTLDSETNLNPNNQNSPKDTDFKLLKNSQNPPQTPPRTKTATFNLGPNKPQNCFLYVHKQQGKKKLVNFKHNHCNNKRRKISQLPDTTTIVNFKN
jgi:hypothetical protein